LGTEDTVPNSDGLILPISKKIQYGLGGCEIVPATRTATSVQLRTFIYRTEQDVTINGVLTPRGTWIPCAPSEVRFYYTLFSTSASVTLLAQKENQGQVHSEQNSIPQTSGNTTKSKSQSTREAINPLATSLVILHPLFPNPADNAISIRYDLTQAAKVQLEICTMLGQRIALLTEQMHSEGEHEYAYATRHLANGVYMLRMTTEQPNGMTVYRAKQFTILR
jgi:Secretion system C-terminal sorting domain